MTLYRGDDRSVISVRQYETTKYTIYCYSYNKFQYAYNVDNLTILKQKIIDFIVNGYTIQINNLFKNLFEELNSIDEENNV